MNDIERPAITRHVEQPIGSPRRSRRRLACGCWLLGASLLAPSHAAAQVSRPTAQGVTLEEVLAITLRGNPNIQMAARQVEAQEGALIAAADPFDVKTQTSLLSTRYNNLTADPRGSPFWLGANQTQYGIGAQKQMRNGLLFSPEVAVSKTALSTTAAPPTGQAAAKVSVLVPLLRDHGGVGTSAPERAAVRAYGAGVLRAQHVTAQAIFAAAVAYWDYLAAVKRLEAIADSEARAVRLAEDTRRLVELGERTPADLTQVLGNVSAKRVNRMSAEQAVVDARASLGLQTGLGPTETAALPAPITEFPTVDEAASVALAAPALVDEALARRPDLLATQKDVEAATVTLAAARDGLKPRVDVIGSVGYVGLQLGTGLSPLFSSIYRNVPGPEASVQVRYQWAAANLGARGRLMQSVSEYEQERLAQADLRRQIGTAVYQATNTIARAAATMQESREAVALYQSMVRSEQRKFQLGVSTLFDTIQAADGLTAVTVSEIAAAREYTVAVAILRFQTGALTMDRQTAQVELGKLLSPY